MARIRLEGIAKRFGAVTALEKLDLEIHDREFMVLLGPSGCGKTTTLNIVAGLEEPSEGTLRFDDADVTETPPHKREVAMVFQSYALYPQKTVYENVAFGLRLRKMPGAEIDARVRAAAEQLEITHLLDRRPHQLSGGQRQRVALGRAIVRHPSVFLMDEPLSNLDAALRGSMRTLIKKLHRQVATTVVYVTHDQAEAMTLADRITVMRGGVVQQIDTPDGIYNRPRNRFVAGFLGSPQMNFVAGEIAADGAMFRAGALTQKLAASQAAGRKVILGLRPEDVEPAAGRAPDLEGVVALVSPLGSEQHVNLAVGDSELVLRLDKGVRVAAGDRLGLVVAPGRLHLFDAESELSLATS
jgi:multiple sugar transport system ATP-binding protein